MAEILIYVGYITAVALLGGLWLKLWLNERKASNKSLNDDTINNDKA